MISHLQDEADTLVVTHANCMDGLGAVYAWALTTDEPFMVHEANYGDFGPDGEGYKALLKKAEGRNVVFVDFCLDSAASMLGVKAVAKSLSLYDHHKTAGPIYETLKPVLLQGAFDVQQSGAGITYRTRTKTTDLPLVLALIEDGDLWRFTVPHTHELSAVLRQGIATCQAEGGALYNRLRCLSTFSSWCGEPNMLEEVVKTGASIRATIDTQAAESASKLKDGFYGDHRVRRGNVLGNISLVGNKAVENGKADFSATYFFKEDGIIVSLRADKVTDVDVSAIAKYFGGGGHAKAAGFEIALPLGQRGTDQEALSLIGLDRLWPTYGR